MVSWFLVYTVVTVVHDGGVVQGCNVRELSEVVQRRFREEVAAQCSSIGDKCSFDRECCKGLECLMSASKAGVGLSCQRAVLADPDRGDMMWETPVDSLPQEPKSEDTDWMVVKSTEDMEEENRQDSEEEKNKNMYPTDMFTEIDKLQQKKKQKLLRENYELEKLFTEREEKELEQLRALREDAEMDELRRLKELRLRRKLQLIKELKELRGLKAEEELNALNELKKLRNANKTDNELSLTNKTDVSEYTNSNKPSLNTTLEENPQSPKAPTEPQEGGNVPKHKQGIHESHHKKKHHHHKRKDPHQSLNVANQTQNADPDRKENETG